MPRYRIRDYGPVGGSELGINYPSGGPGGVSKRAVVGDVVDDLPEQSIGWLLADGIIEPADQPAPADPESEPEVEEED